MIISKTRMQRSAKKRIHKKGVLTRLRSWYSAKTASFRFVAIFCALTIGFYILSITPWYQGFLSSATTVDARIAGAILSGIGVKNHVFSAAIYSGDNAIIAVQPACTAIEFWWFVCSGVIAFPASIVRKAVGILVGVGFQEALNLVRVMTLFYFGVRFPKAFDLVHEQLWGIALVIATVAYCGVWVAWAYRDNEREADDKP